MARVVIVGAGIGGLCAARAVALAGHEPVVLERASTETAVGAGLLLWPNAVRALDRLGLGAAVRAAAAPVRHTVIRARDGRLLSELDVGALGRRAGAPMLVIDRPALHRALGDGVAVRAGARVVTVDQDAATLEDGERVQSDAVVAADGIGSVVRNHVCPGVGPVDCGHTVLRGIAAFEIGAGEAFESWGRGELVGGVSLGDGRSYWFYEGPSVNEHDPLSTIDPTRWPAPFADLLACTPRESLLINRILRLPVLPAWTRGTVALLGDAAHAMEPNLGQGAAQTIEDAEALLIALRAGDELPVALRAYEQSRRRRADWLQRESSRAAWLALSRHTGPRDLIMRLTPGFVRQRVLEQLMQRRALDLSQIGA